MCNVVHGSEVAISSAAQVLSISFARAIEKLFMLKASKQSKIIGIYYHISISRNAISRS
jgi:hypothetical protein